MKIAIVTNQMVMGGIEKSLITLLKEFTNLSCEVTLFLCKPGGELYNEIPKEIFVKELYEGRDSVESIIKTTLSDKGLLECFKNFCRVIHNKYEKDTFKIWERSLAYAYVDSAEYDIAIAYASPVSLSSTYVSSKMSAKKKIVWIHNEIDKIGFDVQALNIYYDGFDRIFCVSERCKEIFLKYLPQYKSKTEVFYNFVDKKELEFKAISDEGFNDSYEGIHILTVGRVCKQKGQDIIPKVLQILQAYDYQIKWYCIGGGDEYIRYVYSLAREYKVENSVIFLGNKANPYPYFKECDIYVQPSRHEGFGITISEAKCFKKPIILTEFAGSDEQICNGIDGVIVPFDAYSIADAIKKLIEDKSLRDRISEEAYKSGISCCSDIQRIIGE